jgi:hypothetical protein
MNAAWEATPLPPRKLPRTELRGKLGPIEQLLPAPAPEPRPRMRVTRIAGKPTKPIWDTPWLQPCGQSPGEPPDPKACSPRAQLVRLVFDRGQGETDYDLNVEFAGQRHPELVEPLRALLRACQFEDSALVAD